MSASSDTPTPLSSIDAHLQQQVWAQWFSAASSTNPALLATYLRLYSFDVDTLGPGGTSALMEASYAGDVGSVEVLLEHGAEPGLEATSGGDSLHQAAAGGHSAVVERLLDAGALIDSVDSRRGGTALTQAIVRGHLKLVRLLLSRGASAWAGVEGFSPFEMAVGCGNEAAVSLLLAQRGADWRDDWRERALWVASATNQLDWVRRMAEEDFELGWYAPNGRNALQEAAARGHAEIVAYWLDRGLDANERTRTGWAPLHLAVRKGSLEAASVLLRSGADPDAGEPGGGFTALMQAAARGDLPLVEVLLAHGADPERRDDEQGRNASEWATASEQSEVARLLSTQRRAAPEDPAER